MQPYGGSKTWSRPHLYRFQNETFVKKLNLSTWSYSWSIIAVLKSKRRSNQPRNLYAGRTDSRKVTPTRLVLLQVSRTFRFNIEVFVVHHANQDQNTAIDRVKSVRCVHLHYNSTIHKTDSVSFTADGRSSAHNVTSRQSQRVCFPF